MSDWIKKMGRLVVRGSDIDAALADAQVELNEASEALGLAQSRLDALLEVNVSKETVDMYRSQLANIRRVLDEKSDAIDRLYLEEE